MVQNNAISHQAALSATVETSPANYRENQTSINMNIPTYVTIYNDPKAGRSFLCNPCQVHCNSDTQISQHLTSKKHVDKVNGKVNYEEGTETNLTPAALISWTAEQQAANKDYYKYDNRKSNIYCEVCRLNFSHEYVLKTHIAGQKHQRKVNSIELLQSLLGSEPGLEIEPETGNGRCTFCDVIFYSPQHITRHLTGEKHIAAKGGKENGTGGSAVANKHPAGQVAKNNSANAIAKKGNRPQPSQALPSCISKAGERFLCNPCQSHCNSDTQLQQHLASKKHVDKVSGRKKAIYGAVTGAASDGVQGRGRGRGRGGGRGRGRGRGATSSLSNESYGTSWAEALLAPTTSSFYNPTTSTSIDYGHGSYSDTSFGVSSIGNASSAEYGFGGSFAESTSRPIGGGKVYTGFGARSDPSPYARPESARAPAPYERSEGYHRPDYEYPTARVDEYEAYRKPIVADYMPETYRKTTVADYMSPTFGAGHPGERGMPLSYQPLSQNFIASSTLI